MTAGQQILILGGDADGNLGDRAILQSMCRELLRNEPEAIIRVVVSNPEETVPIPGVKSISKGPRGFVALCWAALRSDMVLCGGGGLFQDDDSLIKMPYWAMRVMLMRLFCRRIIGYSLGVGPLRTGVSKFFARLAFSCMEKITVRDVYAQQTAQALTRKEVVVVPDPAILISPVDDETVKLFFQRQNILLDDSPLIGLAPRRWFPPCNRIIPHRIKSRIWPKRLKKSAEEEQMICQIAEVLDHLIQQHNAYILFLPTYGVDHEGDVIICEKVMHKMKSSRGKVLTIDQPSLYKGVTGKLTMMLGGRMHPTIFSMAMGVPCVALAYNKKFHGFFESLGLSSLVLDVEEFVFQNRVDDLIQLCNSAMNSNCDLSGRVASLAQVTQSFNEKLEGKAE